MKDGKLVHVRLLFQHLALPLDDRYDLPRQPLLDVPPALCLRRIPNPLDRRPRPLAFAQWHGEHVLLRGALELPTAQEGRSCVDGLTEDGERRGFGERVDVQEHPGDDARGRVPLAVEHDHGGEEVQEGVLRWRDVDDGRLHRRGRTRQGSRG